MNKTRQIIVVLTVCIIIVGFISACSDRDEKHREGRDVLSKNYTKKDPNRKETLAFFDALKEISQKEHGKGSEGPNIFMHTLKPEDDQGVYYSIGDCFLTVSVEVDGDKKKEKICLRYLKYKEYDDIYTYVSLITEIFKGKKQVLCQELDRGYFFEERFVAFKDIDYDGKTELVTKVRFSPDCSGCEAYRIYTFKEDRFELSLNLFDIKFENPYIKNFLDRLPGFEEMILKDSRGKTKSEHPCGLWDSCIKSGPWAVDSDYDGRPEVVFLVRPPEGTDSDTNKYYNLFLAKFTKSGKLAGYNIHKIDVACCDAFVDFLGFLGTQNKHTHLLINYAYTGNSSASPVLHIFDVKWTNVKKVGEFSGFYEHTIAERLRDLDGDGNTEIIYLEDTYWPPGKSHAYIIPVYGIAEYQDGRYVEANDKFKSTLERLNNQ